MGPKFQHGMSREYRWRCARGVFQSRTRGMVPGSNNGSTILLYPRKASNVSTFKYSKSHRETARREGGGGGGGHGLPSAAAARSPGAVQAQRHPRQHEQRRHGGCAPGPPIGERPPLSFPDNLCGMLFACARLNSGCWFLWVRWRGSTRSGRRRCPRWQGRSNGTDAPSPAAAVPPPERGRPRRTRWKTQRRRPGTPRRKAGRTQPHGMPLCLWMRKLFPPGREGRGGPGYPNRRRFLTRWRRRRQNRTIR